jgi:hypothetical protein
MAELADALDSGSSGVKPVQVQVLFLAPRRSKVRFAPFFIAKKFALLRCRKTPLAPLLLLFPKKL